MAITWKLVTTDRDFFKHHLETFVPEKILDTHAHFYRVKYYCKNYPNIKLILDHCARGFNTSHPMEGLSQLKYIDNLWVDISSVTNPFVIEVALKTRGPKRVLFGSDYYVSHIRGTTVSVADTFLWWMRIPKYLA